MKVAIEPRDNVANPSSYRFAIWEPHPGFFPNYAQAIASSRNWEGQIEGVRFGLSNHMPQQACSAIRLFELHYEDLLENKLVFP